MTRGSSYTRFWGQATHIRVAVISSKIKQVICSLGSLSLPAIPQGAFHSVRNVKSLSRNRLIGFLPCLLICCIPKRSSEGPRCRCPARSRAEAGPGPELSPAPRASLSVDSAFSGFWCGVLLFLGFFSVFSSSIFKISLSSVYQASI